MTGAHTTRIATIALSWAAALALAGAGCSDAPAPLPRASALGEHPAAAHEVRVRLEFGADADLDLFVTDPMHEEIYFANSPSRLGGVFEADRRCDDPARPAPEAAPRDAQALTDAPLDAPHPEESRHERHQQHPRGPVRLEPQHRPEERLEAADGRVTPVRLRAEEQQRVLDAEQLRK